MDILWSSRRYISAEILAPYAPLRVRVVGLGEENVGTDEAPEVKHVLQFDVPSDGRTGRLVLNKTNLKILAALLGRETNAWPGKEILLGVEKVLFKGTPTDAVRIQRASPTEQVRP